MSEAKIVITAEGAQAEATMRRLGDSAQDLGKKFLDLTGLAGGLAGALSITAFAAFVQNTVNGIDALNDLSDATGASIENLSALEDMAARTGTNMDVVGAALVKFNQTLEAAKPGSGAEMALRQIGLSADELKKLDPAEALRQTALALNNFADDGDKARLLQVLFGKSVREVASLLKDLAEGGELVAKVTREQADAADQFNKNLAELKKNATDASRAMVGDLVIGLNKLAEAFKQDGLSGLLGGLRDDEYKNNVKIVDGTNRLLDLENALAGARSRGVLENSKYIQNIKAQIEETKAGLNTALSYKRLMEEGPAGPGSGGSAGGGTAKASVGPLADPAATKQAQADLDKLRQQDIQGWVKYADAVLSEGERIDEMLRKQVEDENTRQAASEAAWLERTAARLAQIQTDNLTVEELQRGHLATIQADLEAARNAGFLTEQQYNELLYQETLKHQARMGNSEAKAALARAEFARKTEFQKTQFVLNEMIRMTAAVGTQSRALFNINKVAAIAEASMKLPKGVSDTFNSYPYPWNIPMAAAHLVTGLAHIQQIKSAQFGSSTSAPSIAGGAAVPVFDATTIGAPGAALQEPAASIPAQRTTLNVTVTGDNPNMYAHVVEDLAPALVEAIGNGAIDLNINYGRRT